MNKLLLIVFLLVSSILNGQGAATPQAAFADPSSFWFELDQDFTNGGVEWDVSNSTLYRIELNQSIDNTIPASTHPRATYSFFDNSNCSANYEEWFIIKTPSNDLVNIQLSVDDNNIINTPPFGYLQTSLIVYGFNQLSDLSNINDCSSSSSGVLLISEGSMQFGFTSIMAISHNEGYSFLAVRIGNNNFAGFIGEYVLNVWTQNDICGNSLEVPIADGTKNPFFGNTDRAPILDNTRPDDSGNSPFYGANNISTSTGLGNWFKSESIATEDLFVGLCGSVINPQIMVYNQCPPDGTSGEYIAAEDQNTDLLSDPNRCLNDGNDPNWPVFKLPTTVSDVYYYYIFGANDENGEFDFYLLNQESDILPVEWIDFNGNPYSKANLLEWTTASEQNNDYFIIDKSSDGENYSQLGGVQGSGNATFENSYSFIDDSPFPTTFYRLSQVDFDGTIHIGPNTVVENRNSGDYFNIITNPIETNTVSLSYHINKDKVIAINLYNSNGLVVFSEEYQVLSSDNRLDFSVDNISSGVYALSIRSADIYSNHKLIINHLD